MTAVLIGVMGILLCTAMLVLVLRQQRPELALGVSLAAGAVVLTILLRQLTPLLSSLRQLMQNSSVPMPYITVVLKAAGICVLTQLTADTCRDAGETALAGKAELAGRLMLLALSVPLFAEILTLVTSLAEVSG